jgi:signal transduction histidine kinase
LLRSGRGDFAAGTTPSVSAEVLKFTAAALAVLAALAGIAALILRNVSEDEAIDQAKQVTGVLARGAVEPAIEPGLLEGDPEARARVDRVVRSRVLSPDVVRVKIWSDDGRIVYSDEPRLIDSRYELQEDDLAAFREGAVEAEVSDLSRPENRFDRGHGELLEVYLPIEVPGAGPVLFETYQRLDSVTAGGDDLLGRFAPALIGALVAIAVLLVPFVWSLARRLRREHEQREMLLRRALSASDLERRRIAADVHDGILQDLSAAAFSLSAVSERTREGGSRETLSKAAAACRRAVRTLRSMLVEIYPARLREEGLESALGDLLSPLAEMGVDTALEAPAANALPEHAAELSFRVGQEALRNVAEHANATHVGVRVTQKAGMVQLVVSDDGDGFAPERVLAAQREGHLGLRLLRDLAADAGGELRVDSAPGRGTTVTLEVPIR